MSHKFGSNREVTFGYAKIPMYYTGIRNPKNANKELVLMDRIGANYIACWRNDKLAKVGIEFLVEASERGFIFKDKEYCLGNKVY